MKTKNTFLFVCFTVLICMMTLLGALADSNTHCEKADCNGVYVNGFCTESDEHYQSPNQAHDANGNLVYEISNAGQLYWIAAQTNDAQTTFSNSTVKLTDDIVVNPGTFDENGNYTSVAGETPRFWKPIAALSDSQFCGNFDGDGHTVSGLCMNGPTEFTYVGLIGNLVATETDCSVQNVGIINSYMSCSFDSSQYSCCVGGVVGSAYCYLGKTLIISDCYNDGSVVYKSSSSDYFLAYIGGVVCDANNYGGSLIIANCNNTGTLSVSSYSAAYIGGVVGTVSAYIDDADAGADSNELTTIITNCSNSGEIVYDTTNGTCYIGGIVGSSSISGNVNLTVKLCYNASIINNIGSDNYIGGVMGACSEYSYGYSDGCINISDCFYKLDYDDDIRDFSHNNLYGIGYYNSYSSASYSNNENFDRGTQPVADDVSVEYTFDDDNPTEFWSIAFGDGSLAYFMNKRFVKYYASLDTSSPLYKFYSKEIEDIENFSTTICYPWKQTLNRTPSDKYPLLTGPTVKYDDVKDIYYNDAIAIAPSVKGAQIRSDGKYGLRFGFVYDGSEKAVADYDADTISYGVLLVPKSVIGDRHVTYELINALKNEYDVEIIADVAKEVNYDDTDETAIIYTAVIYDIPYTDESDNKYDVEIFALPYVTYSIDNVKYTSYGESITRSVNQVKQISDGSWATDDNLSE